MSGNDHAQTHVPEAAGLVRMLLTRTHRLEARHNGGMPLFSCSQHNIAAASMGVLAGQHVHGRANTPGLQKPLLHSKPVQHWLLSVQLTSSEPQTAQQS